ncbi:MAG: twin-arginine translocase TatA/TatE family subunit [Chloroflexi bacterium]|nr:twin-arginine translocase TatA/TatE family subunit [Chloroflexota bacterium]
MFGRGIGPLEIFLIVVVVLIIFGAGRLPEVGRGIGTAIKEFRGSIGNKDNAENADEKKTDVTDVEKSD